MKCAVHNSEAIGVCAFCGRAICAACAQPPAGQRLTCSDACAAALARDDRAIRLILQKSVQSARANAVYSFLCGGVSAAGAVGAWHYYMPAFLIWFTAACSVAFIISGIWFSAVARKQS